MLSQKGFAHILLVLILLFGLAAGVYLVQHPTFFKPKAFDSSQNISVNPNINGVLVPLQGQNIIEGVISPSSNGIELRKITGEQVWRVNFKTDELYQGVVAAGDFTKDGASDYVISLGRLIKPEKKCGTTPMRTTWLAFIDGKDGKTYLPVSPMEDKCWNFTGATYPSSQWVAGTAIIGDFTNQYKGNEVVVTPYYATAGWVMNFADKNQWVMAQGGDGNTAFFYPSSSSYDTIYNQKNSSPCMTGEANHCYVANSHVPSQTFINSGGNKNLLVLTSARAVLYKPDFFPTGDIAWYTANKNAHGGRNYGLIGTFNNSGSTYANLIGGCTVNFTREAMKSNKLPDSNCNLHRHYESFQVNGNSLTHLNSIFYSYSNEDGNTTNRVEYPAKANFVLNQAGEIGTVFNLYKNGGHWWIQLFKEPNKGPVFEKQGWFVWDTADIDNDGVDELLATRVTPAGKENISGYYFPSWNFDVLKWTGSDFNSIYHFNGHLPALLQVLGNSVRNSSSFLTGSFSGDINRDGIVELLVEDSKGIKSWLQIGNQNTVPSPAGESGSPSPVPSLIPDQTSEPVASSSPISNPKTDITLSKDLIAYWKMDDSSSDVTDDKGSYSRAANGTTVIDGILGKARQFNGSSSDYIVLGDGPNSPLRQSSAITYSAWVNIPDGGGGWITGSGAKGGQGYGGVRIGHGGISFAWTPKDPGIDTWVTSGSGISPDNWHHIVVSADFINRNVAIYLDGVKQTVNSPAGVNNWTPDSRYNNLTDYLGARTVNETQYFKGSLDEVQIWNKALSADEVHSLYQDISSVQGVQSSRLIPSLLEKIVDFLK